MKSIRGNAVYTGFNSIHQEQILAVYINLTIFVIQMEQVQSYIHLWLGLLSSAGTFKIRGFTKLFWLLISSCCRVRCSEIEEIVFEQGLLVLLGDDK